MPITELQNVFATTVSYPIYNPPPKPTIPTMPFTAAQLTAFWTKPAQMEIPDWTCTQMALEGLVVPANFKDFNEKLDLDTLFKLMLKPAKVPHGAAGALKEVAHMQFLLSCRFGSMGPVRWYFTTF